MTSPIAPLEYLIQRVDAAVDGAPSLETIATGFPTLDRLLGGGLRRGDLIALGGDVGVGKSALALAIALRAAARRSEVAFFSGEMPVERVLERALAMEGRATIDDLRTGTLDDASRASVGAAALRIRDVMPRFARMPREGAEVLATEIASLTDVELVVVDSLTALPLGDRSEGEALAAAVRILKRAAMEARVALLMTTALPRLDRARPDPRPVLDDYGAMGGVAQLADVVLGLYREEMYRPGYGTEGGTELLLLKNRNGGTGYLDLYFYKQWMRFEDMVE
ncbi:MAG TPA: DnaB-like helicase C-terminal domain-containing protein [Gemmatimonadaceae bacterium]|nr:DnaB-like helicase C-terminal domain-containing protein [Gemmatimonadaceae bacterium]